VALVIALAVLSHWFLDLVVHTPDLPLLGDNSPKLGFGLWNNALITFILEGVLVLAGTWFYMCRTRTSTVTGKYGMPVLAMTLILSNVFIIFEPPLASVSFMIIFSLVSIAACAGVAHWLDGKRT
jgi:hypothetical protein